MVDWRRDAERTEIVMIDWSKPIQTSGGYKARLVGTLARQFRPRLVAYMTKNGEENSISVSESGRAVGDDVGSPYDIINTPEKKPERWVNVYWDQIKRMAESYVVWNSEREAKEHIAFHSRCTYIATLKLPE